MRERRKTYFLKIPCQIPVSKRPDISPARLQHIARSLTTYRPLAFCYFIRIFIRLWNILDFYLPHKFQNQLIKIAAIPVTAKPSRHIQNTIIKISNSLRFWSLLLLMIEAKHRVNTCFFIKNVCLIPTSWEIESGQFNIYRIDWKSERTSSEIQ